MGAIDFGQNGKLMEPAKVKSKPGQPTSQTICCQVERERVSKRLSWENGNPRGAWECPDFTIKLPLIDGLAIYQGVIFC